MRPRSSMGERLNLEDKLKIVHLYSIHGSYAKTCSVLYQEGYQAEKWDKIGSDRAGVVSASSIGFCLPRGQVCLSVTNRNALTPMVDTLSQNAEICEGLIFASKRRCLVRKVIMLNLYQMKYSLMHNSLGTPWPKGF